MQSLDNAYANVILDSIAEGLFTIDKHFRIVFFNRAAEKITGYSKDEVIGKFCKHIFKTSLCFEGCPIASVLESGKNVYDAKGVIKHRGGAEVEITINAAVLNDEKGDPKGGAIAFHTVTDLERLRNELSVSAEFCGIVGRSKKMWEIFDLIEEISDTDVTVLIQGESGTGKEMIANAIQSTSARSDEPFIKVNCSVFPAQLLASELFGHVKGAFTGAIKDRVGRFEIANKGTLFLDEVVEMSPEMQLQLLRVLQEGTFERVGESVVRTVDVQVIAATNADVTKAITDGQFREDLFYRLNVIPISIPPLRDRPEDIPELVNHFIKKYGMIHKRPVTDIDDEALDLLLQYAWPGNVRELENTIAYAFARSKDSMIKAEKLPPVFRNFDTPPKKSLSGTAELPEDEKEELLKLLIKHQWNRSKVAAELGIGRTTLWRKLKDFQIDDPGSVQFGQD